MDHIDDMDQLRHGIGLQAYGQRDPLVEYKMTGYEMFGEMTNMIAETTIRTLFNIRVEQKVEREEVAKVTGTNKDDTSVREPKKRVEKKIYPNDPCPCGSGKKYKQCCGRKKSCLISQIIINKIIIFLRQVIKVVLLDELKSRLTAYEEPLKDLRDSL